MNNKQLGDKFEQEMVEWFATAGYWVHFLTPDKRGAQPFDIIAVRNGRAVVGDCKTSSRKTFSIDRLEDNQRLAFERWIACGNEVPYVFIKYRDVVWFVPYTYLLHTGKVALEADNNWAGGRWLE
jgi:Holliday junction resolvase